MARNTLAGKRTGKSKTASFMQKIKSLEIKRKIMILIITRQKNEKNTVHC